MLQCHANQIKETDNMATFAISTGVDPDQLRIQAMEGDAGGFTSREDAAKRLIAIADGRMDELRRSVAYARRVLRAEAAKK
jgi:hypothetical protein